MPNLAGLHDIEAARVLPPDTWVLDTLALSENPSSKVYPSTLNIIARLNWGYGSTGTIPVPEQYTAFALKVARHVSGSKNCRRWIIGNEPNLPTEWPDGRPIYPKDYANCYKLCRSAIHAVAGHEHDEVLLAAIGPWNVQLTYPGNESGDWIKYFTDVIALVGSEVDGFALHAYTHGYDVALVTSLARMDAPFQNRFYHFRTYQDYCAAIPDNLCGLPVYITEANGNGPWQATGLMPAMLAEINDWNGTSSPAILCVIFYRFPNYDQYGMDGKADVLTEFHAAAGKGYTSPQITTQNYSEQISMPEIKVPAAAAPESTLPPRDVDPRAAARGTQIQPVNVAPGQQFWRVKRLYTPNEADSDKLGPDHHILANVLIDGQRQVGMPLLVTWGGGGSNEQASIQTKKSDPFAFSADFPMSPGPFTLAVNDGKPSERVVGIKMGEQTEQGFNPGIHESTLVDFELTTMPALEQPSQPPQPQQPVNVPLLTHPIQDPAKRIISQPFGAKDEDYSKFGLAGHNGVDFAVPTGTDIAAADGGYVAESTIDEDGYGEYVKLIHSWGETLYAHLSKRSVDVGLSLNKGQIIGKSGYSGNVDPPGPAGAHLHFGLRVNPYQRGYPYDGYSDPAPYLSGATTPTVQVGLTTKGTIYAASVVYDFDYLLLASLAWAESSWQADAVSSAGALGILQIMPATWAEWSKRIDPAANDPFNDAQNLQVGIAYLKWLLAQTNGNVWDALVAYNWGIGSLLSGATVPSESAEFANKVIHGRDLLKAMGVE